MAFDVPIQKVERKTLYSVHDQGIDWSIANKAKYQETDDLQCLAGAFLDDPKPIAFVLEWVDPEIVQRECQRLNLVSEVYDEVFRILVVGVENGWELDETDANGKPVRWWPQRRERPGSVSRMTDWAFKRVPYGVRQDIGAAGHRWLFPPDQTSLDEHSGNS